MVSESNALNAAGNTDISMDNIWRHEVKVRKSYAVLQFCCLAVLQSCSLAVMQFGNRPDRVRRTCQSRCERQSCSRAALQSCSPEASERQISITVGENPRRLSAYILSPKGWTVAPGPALRADRPGMHLPWVTPMVIEIRPLRGSGGLGEADLNNRG
jgi:hypothetical protein